MFEILDAKTVKCWLKSDVTVQRVPQWIQTLSKYSSQGVEYNVQKNKIAYDNLLFFVTLVSCQVVTLI